MLPKKLMFKFSFSKKLFFVSKGMNTFFKILEIF